MPSDERACNSHPCSGEPRVDASLHLRLPAGSVRGGLHDADTSDGLMTDTQDDLSRALFIAGRRVRVDSMKLLQGDPMYDSGSYDVMSLNFTILPIAGTDVQPGFEPGTVPAGDAEAGGLVSTVVRELTRQADDPESVLRTRGTFLRRMVPESLLMQAREGIYGTAIDISDGALGVPSPVPSPFPADTPTADPSPEVQVPDPSPGIGTDNGDRTGTGTGTTAPMPEQPGGDGVEAPEDPQDRDDEGDEGDGANGVVIGLGVVCGVLAVAVTAFVTMYVMSSR